MSANRTSGDKEMTCVSTGRRSAGHDGSWCGSEEAQGGEACPTARKDSGHRSQEAGTLSPRRDKEAGDCPLRLPGGRHCGQRPPQEGEGASVLGGLRAGLPRESGLSGSPPTQHGGWGAPGAPGSQGRAWEAAGRRASATGTAMSKGRAPPAGGRFGEAGRGGRERPTVVLTHLPGPTEDEERHGLQQTPPPMARGTS